MPTHWTAIALVLTLATPLAGQTPDTEERTTVGGYGEVHYGNRSGANTPGSITLARFVVYLGHQFSDRIAFRSELEVEDAKVEGGEEGGEVALEQAYLDYALSDRTTLRAGLVLAPLGIINELHEPPTFNGVERPGFDHDVLPSTWRELGVGAVGTLPVAGGLTYRLYLLNGLQAEGFSAEEGIRGGRQEGKEASFANPSLTGRLEYGRPGLKLGGAFWYGGSANQDSVLGAAAFAAPFLVLAADARFDRGPLMLRGVVARISLKDAEEINTRFGTGVGSRIEGGYLEVGYNLLRLLAPRSSQKLNAFVRHERYDTHAAVPDGTTRDPSLARRTTTLGLSYKPLWNVVFKGDYQLRRNKAGLGEEEAVALGIGYQF
jgi:hypothetical protein